MARRPGASAMSMDSKQPPSSPQVRALGEHFETALDRAARAAEPPDYDQLAAYVDGTLDDVDREIVESWLVSDPALRAEVEDLRELHDAMASPPARRVPRTRPSHCRRLPAPRPSGVLPFERKAATHAGVADAVRDGDGDHGRDRRGGDCRDHVDGGADGAGGRRGRRGGFAGGAAAGAAAEQSRSNSGRTRPARTRRKSRVAVMRAARLRSMPRDGHRPCRATAADVDGLPVWSRMR